MKKIRVSKKFIYLISPPKIDSKNFFDQLEDVFKTKKISFFQLRLKKTPKKKILYIGKKVVRLCKKYNYRRGSDRWCYSSCFWGGWADTSDDRTYFVG